MAGAFAWFFPPLAYPSTQISKRMYLSHLKFHTPGSLPISNGKIGRETGVSDYRRQRIAMLVYQPLTVWMSWREAVAELGNTYYLLRSACPVTKLAGVRGGRGTGTRYHLPVPV